MDWPVSTGFNIKENNTKGEMGGRLHWVREPVEGSESKQLFPINQETGIADI